MVVVVVNITSLVVSCYEIIQAKKSIRKILNCWEMKGIA